MALFYAGVGSRSTPPDILQLMTLVAEKMSGMGYILRSGGARGADSAFERGADYAYIHGSNAGKEIFRAADATRGSIEFASRFHPAWHSCGAFARKLHGRNVFQILGRDMQSPVRLVICWTPDAELVGGTAMAIRIARSEGIPVFNLANPAHKTRLEAFVS